MTKDNRGGARPGSGRKPGLIKRKPYCFRLSPEEHLQVKNFISKLKEEIKMTKVINKNGHELDFNAAVDYMDDEIREALHSDMAPCGEQEFLSAYEKAHEAKFNEDWFLSSSNPSW